LAQAHGALGLALLQQGRFAQARTAIRRCLKLLPTGHSLRQLFSQQLEHCAWLLALEGRLTAVLQGDAQPQDAAERLALADLAQQRYKRQYAAAARLYADAFAAKEASADLIGRHRYNAARAAALAASGQGKDADKLSDKERAQLRKQALTWLRAELAGWAKLLDEGAPQARPVVQRTLRHWQTDPDLAGVRDKGALARLPQDQRQAWGRLWADVADLVKRTEGPE
jgi:hypothetical protein